jgi:hypothetical protein
MRAATGRRVAPFPPGTAATTRPAGNDMTHLHDLVWKCLPDRGHSIIARKCLPDRGHSIIVIGTPIDISHIYQPTGPFWDAFWDAVQGLLAEAEEAPPDAATHQDWFEERQDLSCDSTVQDRAEWAAAAAGFKPAGTIYQVGYPGGGHQLWIISVRTWLAYEVAEYGSCIE